MDNFYKYHGTGNDFVIIDNRNKGFDISEEKIAHICHRRFGVGADGLILLENGAGYDFSIQYFNADGKTGSLCGNGSRCAVQFAADLGIINQKTHFRAIDGSHHATLDNGLIQLSMNDVAEITTETADYFVDTGSPHLIIFSKDISAIDVKTHGARIRYNPYWVEKGGVNVNFVEFVSEKKLKVRTYERGVEDETYSCGTGAVATALVSSIYNGTGQKVEIETKGGPLLVSFKKDSHFTDIVLSGPAKKVFSGNF